jgi:hypothetical protein
VVIELKVGPFRPEYVGKLGFYLAAVDDLIKDDADNTTIGLILCKSANETIAEYARATRPRRSRSPSTAPSRFLSPTATHCPRPSGSRPGCASCRCLLRPATTPRSRSYGAEHDVASVDVRQAREPSTMELSHPRRQQFRRLLSAGARGAGATVSGAIAVWIVVAGYGPLALAPSLAAVVLAFGASRDLEVSRRNRVGADSEREVRRTLKPLARGGWSVRHGVRVRTGGDLDHVLRAPSGIGFVIETKTSRYARAHVQRTVVAARSLARRRRRYPLGVVPVVCIARGRGVERVEHGALIVSIDRLLPAMSAMAGARPTT